jgi:hypothetical protein
MDAVARTRRCCRTRDEQKNQPFRTSKQICLTMTRESYDRIWEDPAAVRAVVEEAARNSPELFPRHINLGFRLTGHLPESAKLPGIRLRQLRLSNGHVYTLRPSFVMPYMTAFADDVEYPLRLMAFGVPGWLVAERFGHDAHFWDRQVERLGRNSLAGTTVRDPGRLPEHLAADEHHAPWCGEKGYIAITVGEGCVLGIALTESADDEHLTAAYGTFRAEALQVDPQYAPKTVNTDGWKSTQNAWRVLFPLVVVILCFLHGFLKIRDRCRKALALHQRVWEVYRAGTAAAFTEGMRALREWAESQSWPAAVREVLAKLWNRTGEYVLAYAHPGCRRTSNMADRLTNRLYRVLYAHRGLHGHHSSSERRLRGWALLLNFCPYAPRSGRPRTHQCPAEHLNRKRYHDNWLQNLLLSASLGGVRLQT